MSERNVWVRMWYVWAPPALLVVLNVVWLAGLRGSLLGRGSLLDEHVARVKSEVARLESQAVQLGRTERDLTNLEQNLGALHRQQMAPMRERLVPFLTDVVRRTEEAGLQAQRVAYTARRDEKSGLVYFTAGYTVKGSYEQIRQCVYLLESSPQFVLLEGLTLRGEDSAASLQVGVQLAVGTYFSDLDVALMKQLGVNEVASGG